MDICCRFGLLNSTLHLPPLSILSRPPYLFPSFPTCPPKLSKFSHLPLLRRNPIIYTRTRLLCTSSQSSSSTAMEAPPEGYRRNVGICLINDSKKVSLHLLFTFLLYVFVNELNLSMYVCYLHRFLLLRGWIFPVRGKCRR